MLLYQKYLTKIYIIAWSSLLFLGIYDLQAQNSYLIKKQTFLTQVIIMRVLVFFQLITMVSRLRHPTKSLFNKILAIVYTILKISLVMVYFEDDTDQERAIPFIISFSIKGFTDQLINHGLIENKVYLKLVRTIKLILLNPLMLYYGYRVMNNYIKRYAQDISYQQINMIRVQQILLFGWILYFVRKGLKTLVSSQKQQIQKESPNVKTQ